MSFLVKVLEEKELHLIAENAPAIWQATYQEILSQNQIDFMLEKSYTLDSLIQQKKVGCRFLGAYYNNEFVGFASVFSPNSSILRIEKLYLMPKIQGLGLGKLFMNHIKNLGVEEGFQTLELNVNRNNKALNFYQKQGFTIISEVDIPLANYVLNDYIMQCSLINL